MQRSSFYLLLILFTTLSMGPWSCAPRQVAPRTPVDLQTEPTLARTVNTLESSSIQTLSGLAEVDVYARGREQSLQAALLIQSPNQMRLSLLDDLGQEYFRLVADGSQIYSWDLRTGESEVFEQTQSGLQKVLKLPISVEEFIARLTQQLPPGTIQDIARFKDDIPPRYEITRPNEKVILQTTPPRLLAWRALVPERPKKTRYLIHYEDFEKNPNFPRQTVWIFPKPKARVKVDFQTLKLNSTLNENAFATTNPF